MKMGSKIRSIAFVLMVSAFLGGLADAQSNKPSDAQKKKAKVERSYKKAYAKARKKTIKHRREIQTDDTKKRMDAADKRADSYNKQNDPGFFDRFFKRKRPKKR